VYDPFGTRNQLYGGKIGERRARVKQGVAEMKKPEVGSGESNPEFRILNSEL
jgi:hypothetical protein